MARNNATQPPAQTTPSEQQPPDQATEQPTSQEQAQRSMLTDEEARDVARDIAKSYAGSSAVPQVPPPAMPDPNSFTVTLPEALADWVRQAACQHGISPGQFLAGTIAAAPLGGDTFSLPLKATEAMWVRARAQQLGMRPADLIRGLVAQARAIDPSKGGTILKTGDAAELQRLAAATGKVA